MANGKAHYIATNYTTVIVGGLTYLLYPEHAFGVGIGLLIGKYATPDVRDQEEQRNYPEFAFSIDFGQSAGSAFSALWYPVAKLIPHRHVLSHLPGLATILAALWLFTASIVFQYYWEQPEVGFIEWMYTWMTSAMMIRVVVGWAIQDFVHWVMDGFPVNI